MKPARLAIIVAAAVTLSSTASAVRAQSAVAPAGAAPATQPAASSQEVMTHLRTAEKSLHDLFPNSTDLSDPAKRAAAGPQGIALGKQITSDLDALLALNPQAKRQLTEARASYTTILVALGDQETIGSLDQAAKSADPVAAAMARRVSLQGQWYLAGKDAAAQGKLVDQVEAFATADPASIPVTQLAQRLSSLAATPELTKRLQGIVGTMKNPAADQARQMIAAVEKLKSNEGKPIAINGQTVDGKAFSMTDFQGKVVLVDFWATWCGPCVAELPRVKKAYADFHAKGLEVLGVSNDFSADALTSFVAKESMPWPQLFNAEAAASQSWNPTTLGFGIHGIPAMFLIDKKGICRSVDARSNFEEMIPKLLAE